MQINKDKRIEDAVQNGYTNLTTMANQSKEMLNLTHGGMFGHFPALGTQDNKGEFISNQAYVGMDVIPILIQAPGFFEVINAAENGTTESGTTNNADLEQILKSLVELHPQSIEGLNAGITAEFADVAVGGGGEIQEDIVDMKRARTEVVFTWVEKVGRPIQRFLDFWMRYGGMDPDTKSALIGTVESYEGKEGDVYTYDRWRMTMLFIEPDITQRYAADTWLVASMFPKDNGEVKAGSNKTAAKEIRELSIPFTGIAMINDSTRAYGNQCLKVLRGGVLGEDGATIGVLGTSPDNAPTFVSKTDPNLTGNKGFNGTRETECVVPVTNADNAGETNIEN